ncbi:hypothetical protein SeMB42_g05360 [Synchytrium endobioticum]|uniref:Uncharacterized protein n=1 Tax=Synchytrium endobioticum TaxID=286115 RepID=A0A507CRX6_9FUNG|nr:hypothetical protein SeLEV6574_g07270 [Synchytrium endobioticum]TPX41905.1 hypothetical protein SeMB42_g05360 [Synchytrium endobioticum]
MVKAVNLVIFLAAIITSIETAPVWDDDAILKVMQKMHSISGEHVSRRTAALGKPLFDHNSADMKSHMEAQIAETVSKSIPPFSPFSKEQLFQEPHESTPVTQILFTRAYHSLLFERLKTLFLQIQLRIAELPNSGKLKKGLDSVAPYLLWSQDLEKKCRKRLYRLRWANNLDGRRYGPWRALTLPEYDWERVLTILLPNLLNQLAQSQSPLCNNVTPAGMLEWFQIRIKNVIDGAEKEICRGLPFDLRAVSDPTPYVATLIAQIRSDSLPFAFTEEQLLEEPRDTMLQSQLDFARMYHLLVVETLSILAEMIRDNFSRGRKREKLEKALAEVKRATDMHRNLESKYEIIIPRTPIKSIGWQENMNLPAYQLAPANSIQYPTEGQYSAYNYEQIFDHGPGCGLEASTSQPKPQPVLIDFLGVEDTTGEATPELAPRFGYSHDDRYPPSDELHRPPGVHVGFVGGRSMHPDTSTGNIKRPCDSSLYGHTTTSNTRVAGSPQTNTRVRLFGQWLDAA